MDQVAFSFGFGKAAGSNNAAAGAVRLHGVSEGRRISHSEDRLQHFDHVIESVFIVIENDDVIELAEFVLCRVFDIGV